jgi:hypothetical protein
MGLYINPIGMSKEDFLEKYGKKHTFNDVRYNLQKGYAIVVLVDNLIFTAAGVAYDQRELDDLNNPSDDRPKKCYVVPFILLTYVCQNKHLNSYFRNSESKSASFPDNLKDINDVEELSTDFNIDDWANKSIEFLKEHKII